MRSRWRCCLSAIFLPTTSTIISAQVRYAQKAIELDDQDYIAAMVLGRVNLYDGNYEEAEYYLRKSVNLNPNDTDNLIQVSTCLTMLGYAEEALKLYERAFQLNPVNIQRPESHTYHHARGIHKMNYSDLPLFDILFGTFYNPQKFEYETGFYHGASARIPEMLMFREISGEEGAETVTVRGVAGVEERKVPA